MKNFVLARAVHGEPVCRVVMAWSKKLIYLANPARLDAIRTGATNPIGFPREDVFAYDETLYRRLRKQWETTGATDPALWAIAILYQ